MKPEYGQSPLVSFCAEILRQREIAELRHRLNTCQMTTSYDNTKRKVLTDQQKNDMRIPIISDKELEWLPMGDDKAICNAFGVPYDLLIRL